MREFFQTIPCTNNYQLINDSAGKRYEHNTKAFKVDVDANPAAKEFFDIKTTPTIVVYKNGKELKKVEGLDGEKAKEVASVLV